MTPAGVTPTLPAPPRQLRRGLGIVASVVVHGMFVQVRRTAVAAADLVPLPAGWAQRVARRAIVLPHQRMQTLTLATDEQVYLLITTALDATILAGQLAAAEQHGVALDALRRTHGRLLRDSALAFRIDTVESVK